MRRGLAGTLLGATLALALLETACGTNAASSDSGQPPELGPVTRLTNAENITLPLDFYRPTPQQDLTINTARDILTRDCMRRFGFDWAVQNRSLQPIPSGQYGISNAAEVTRFGYHVPPDRTGGRNGTPGAPAPSVAEQEVSTGRGPSSYGGKQVPPGGCLGEADAKLGRKISDGTTVENAVLSFANKADAQFRADSRTLDLWHRWSDCMHASGYDYHDPWAANDDPAWSGPVATPREINTATTDLACRNKLNLAGVSLAIETAYQKRIIEQNPEVLQQLKQQVEHEIQVATNVVGTESH